MDPSPVCASLLLDAKSSSVCTMSVRTSIRMSQKNRNRQMNFKVVKVSQDESDSQSDSQSVRR